ncbi:hypothetical protein LCGC14_0782860 [marine sediment metagenome]|uniref:DUF7210 domain-containing protein n=1 Tax=marine sediment metagenome TaxID=412755 RepID=A0A0F9T202_9ZZZZ
MRTFTVKSHIKHDGKLYQPGETIELSNKQAAAVGSAVEGPASKAAAKAEVEQEEPGTGSEKEKGGRQPSKTFQFRALKAFKFKKQEYKKGQVMDLDLVVAQEIGSEQIEMVDPEAYHKYMKEQQAANRERQKQAGAGRAEH